MLCVCGWNELVCVVLCVCVYVCGWNELVCTMLAYPHISSSRIMPVLSLHKHTCILKPSEDSELTGLKVDIAHLSPFPQGGLVLHLGLTSPRP